MQNCPHASRLPLALLPSLLILFAGACARIGGELSPADAPLALELTLAQPDFAPGEPVRIALTLANQSGESLSVSKPDHASVAFSVFPRRTGGAKELKYVSPVFSDQEPTGLGVELAPGETFRREFLFTVLTLDRGDFILQAKFTLPSNDTPTGRINIHSRAVGFTVRDESVLVHRYPDGLLAPDDAIAIARRELALPADAPGDVLLIRDELGFHKWWVNVRLSSGAFQGALVDPYLAKFLRKTDPFTDNDRNSGTVPAGDTKAVQDLKDRRQRR